MGREKLFIGMLLLIGSQLLQGAEPDPVMVPTPRARVLASTANSRPFLAVSRAQQPVDLLARGYAESEFTVRGFTSNSQPFVTRMLVRRPQVAGKFSGRVIVELLNASSQYETAPLWGFSWDYFLRRGDAWVGVTVSPAAAAALRKFNSTRYGALSLAAVPAGVCGNPLSGGFAAEVLAQTAALLRSSSKENPLLALNPQRLIAAGHAEAGEAAAIFATALHGSLRLGDGQPIFDGYLNVSGLAPVHSPDCTAAIPRRVPFVSVLNEADTLNERDGGDAQTEGFRVYEVVGVAGAGLLAAGAPAAADLAAAGFTAGAARCREPIMDLMMSHAMNAVWEQFDELLVGKQPMLNLPQIQYGLHGGTLGGWRLPQVDLPLAGQVPGRRLVSTQSSDNAPLRPLCDATTGSMPRFDAATLKQLYRSRAEYLRLFNTAVDQAVMSRLLVKEDADALKAAALRTTPTF